VQPVTTAVAIGSGPSNPALVATAHLNRVSELEQLLDLDAEVARALAQRAIRDDGVEIELDQE